MKKKCKNCCHYIANLFCNLELEISLPEDYCKWKRKGFLDRLADNMTSSMLDDLTNRREK